VRGELALSPATPFTFINDYTFKYAGPPIQHPPPALMVCLHRESTPTPFFSLIYDRTCILCKAPPTPIAWCPTRAAAASSTGVRACTPFTCLIPSVRLTCHAYLLEIEGLFTQGLRPGRTVGESVGGILEIDSSDWSNGIRYHIIDTRPDTEFN